MAMIPPSHGWPARAWAWSRGFAAARPRPDFEVYDRLGGGDSFVSGLCYDLLALDDLNRAVEYGAANGAIAHTSLGDTTTASLAELDRLIAGTAPRVMWEFRPGQSEATLELDHVQGAGRSVSNMKPDAPPAAGRRPANSSVADRDSGRLDAVSGS
jgi:hypothetical protein